MSLVKAMSILAYEQCVPKIRNSSSIKCLNALDLPVWGSSIISSSCILVSRVRVRIERSVVNLRVVQHAVTMTELDFVACVYV